MLKKLLQISSFHTVYANKCRIPKIPPYIREEFTLPDGDFLDIDVWFNGNSKVLFLLHGLEGSSKATYIRRASYFFNKKGYDIVAFNYRGCSGRINKNLCSYHSGKTEDILPVLDKYASKYKHAFVMGFSLGGNKTLLLGGRENKKLPTNIKALVAVSAPVDLSSGLGRIEHGYRKLYQYYFLPSLKPKVRKKMKQFPDWKIKTPLNKIKSLRQFDDNFTAPINGFKSAADYYAKCSSKQYLEEIPVPTLIIGSKDDDFLPEPCLPEVKNKNVTTIYTKYGGHVSFALDWRLTRFLHHEKGLEFFENQI